MKGLGYLLKEGIGNVWNNRMMSIASIGVLISCLLLTGAAGLISINVQRVVDKVGDSNVTNVYLQTNVTAKEAKEIGTQIGKIHNVDEVEFYSKDKAIGEFEDTLGTLFSEMQGEQNPLPDAYHIAMEDLSMYDSTVKQIKEIDGVDEVSNRRALAQRITSLNNLVAWMSVWIIIILGAISLFIISNTIKMSMHSRRFEISIMKSVGATNNFVRVPFVVEGMLIGLLSGLLAYVALYFLYNGIKQAVEHIVSLGSAMNFDEISLVMLISFVSVGVLIGALSGMISIRKYLKMEGNEILGW